jgi:hypothetical protein
MKGNALSKHIMSNQLKSEYDSAVDGKPYYSMSVEILDFCTEWKPQHRRLYGQEIEDYRETISSDRTLRSSGPHIPALLTLELSPNDLWVYCYLYPIATQLNCIDLDWFKVQVNSGMCRRDFFSSVLNLKNKIIEHPNGDYPVLITDLEDEMLEALSKLDEGDEHDK